MTLTMRQAEAILIHRLRGKMEIAGMDVTTFGGNPDLNGPLVDALFGMGITPADIETVTDDDIGKVGEIDEFLDRAEYRLLRDIAGNLTVTDITVGPRRENLSQITAQIDKQIDRMKLYLSETYGAGTGTLSAGSISLDFQSSPNDMLNFYSDEEG